MMHSQTTMVLVEQVEQPLEAQVVLLTAKVVVMVLKAVDSITSAGGTAGSGSPSSYNGKCMDQLSKAAGERGGPLAVVVHLVLVPTNGVGHGGMNTPGSETQYHPGTSGTGWWRMHQA